ncbi:MAG: hypothetical protein JRI68_10120 [Deltaproteobacteria bacterium]|nr:hypothetical protein [Deltaproteobacteria bacterium]
MKTIVVALPLALAWAACSPAPPPEAPPPAPPTAEPAAPTASPATPVEPPADQAGRPKSLDDLVNRALAAIKTGDGKAYGQLMFTLDDVTQNCPEALKDVNADMVTRMQASVAKSVAECSKLEWAKAKQLERTGGDRKRPAKHCTTEVWELHDIKVVFEIDGKKVHVKLDDPMVFPDGSHAFADDPRCGDGAGDILAPPDVPPPPPPPGSGADLPETPQ